MCCLKDKHKAKFVNLQGTRRVLAKKKKKKNQESYICVVYVLTSTAHKNQIYGMKQLVQSNLVPHCANFKRFYSGLALVCAMD